MNFSPLEILGLGMRLADRSVSSTIGDDLFVRELAKLFEGDTSQKLASLKAWLATIGVEWSGVMTELPTAVATAMRAANDAVTARAAIARARAELDRAERMMNYQHLAGAESLKSVIAALCQLPPDTSGSVWRDPKKPE